ncbi:MAG: hypothetical protein ABH873_10635 [Candidatus Firestonebacteria bacterium]
MNIQLTEFNLLWEKLVEYFPKVAIGLILFSMGLVLAIFLRLLVTKLLELIRFNTLSDKTGVSEFLRKGQINYTPSKLIGNIIFWAIIILILFFIADISGIKILGPMVEKIANNFPNIFGTVITLIIGSLIVIFIGNFVQTIANNAAFPHANLLSRAIKWIGIIFVLILSFENFNIGSKTLGSTFLIILAAIAFGISLAFGIGCKDIAKDIMEKFIRNLEEKSKKGPKGPDLEG